ncbi:MAG: hypothetical protein A3A86_00215, partial [Elusimicrobia bacterium RIFCSPLOWO2_01_FULL_60_11]
FCVVFGRIEIIGAENVPKEGGVLIASNHLSNLDPPLIGSSLRRPIHFFAKEELFRIPVLGWWISQINAFPVKRGEHDIGAFKKARDLLVQGEGVLLFPEGHRSRTGELGPPRPGAAMLAVKAGVPVVPVCIMNSHRALHFKKLKVAFGRPIRPGTRTAEDRSYDIFAAEIMAAIAALRSKMYNDGSS